MGHQLGWRRHMDPASKPAHARTAARVAPDYRPRRRLVRKHERDDASFGDDLRRRPDLENCGSAEPHAHAGVGRRLDADVSDQGASFGNDLAALLLFDGRLAKRQAARAVANLRAADEPARLARPEVVDLQVRGGGRLTLVAKGGRDGGEGSVGQGPDRTPIAVRSPPDRKTVRLRREVAYDHERAGPGLD